MTDWDARSRCWTQWPVNSGSSSSRCTLRPLVRLSSSPRPHQMPRPRLQTPRPMLSSPRGTRPHEFHRRLATRRREGHPHLLPHASRCRPPHRFLSGAASPAPHVHEPMSVGASLHLTTFPACTAATTARPQRCASAPQRPPSPRPSLSSGRTRHAMRSRQCLRRRVRVPGCTARGVRAATCFLLCTHPPPPPRLRKHRHAVRRRHHGRRSTCR